MNVLAKLVKKRKLSRLCRIGAWIIAVAGVVHLFSQSYALWQDYRQTFASSIQDVQAVSSTSSLFLNSIPAILSGAVSYIFYFIILYSASVIFEAFSSSAAKNEADEVPDAYDSEAEHVVYTSLKPEKI